MYFKIHFSPIHIKQLCIAVIMMLLNGCSSEFAFKDIASLQKELALPTLPTQKDYPEANAVVILDLTHVQVVPERNRLYTYESSHIVKKIFKNVNEESIINIPVFEGEELTYMHARTIRPDGQIIELQPNDFYTISGIGGESLLYANIKTIRFTFPAADKESILEYAFEKRKERPFVNDTWRIQNNDPTLINQYSLSIPLLMAAIVPWKFKTYPLGIDIKPIVNTNMGNTYPITFNWCREKIPAFKPEEMMPPEEEYRTHIRFALSSWNGWDGIAKWYYENFFKSQLIVTDSLKALADRLTISNTSNVEKAKSIYRYVQNIRYVCIQLGESGLQPSPPQLVVDHQYGDCKDKSILCIALFKSIGLQAYPVLVLSSPLGKLDPSFPSWNFNHMIVKVELGEGKKYFIDPTSEFCPFGSLPLEDQNIQVLTIADSSAGIIETTPLPLFKENASEINVKTSLSNDGIAKVRVELNCFGQTALNYRSVFAEKNQTEIKDICKNELLNQSIPVIIDSVSILNQTNLDSALGINIRFEELNALHREGDLLFFNINLFKLIPDIRWSANDNRKYPIWFPDGFTIHETFSLNLLDSALVVRNLPESKILINKNLEYNRSFKKRSETEIIMDEMLSIRQAEIRATEYKAVKGFFEHATMLSEEAVVLTKQQ